MTKLQSLYTIKNVDGHIEIFDFFNRFICSGDNEQDAMEGFDEAYEALERRIASKRGRAFSFFDEAELQ